MRCIDPRIVELFEDHEVSAAFDCGWDRLPDHEIVARCTGRFDVLLTADRGFEHEHNLSKIAFGIVIVHVERNRMSAYRKLQDRMRAAVLVTRPGQVIHVP